jgi:uncharacterized protein DUF3160
VEVTLTGGAPAPEPPIADAQLSKPQALEARWAGLPEPARALLRREGFAVVAPTRAHGGHGAFYASLARERVPYVVTLDTLFAVAIAAVGVALAEAEAREMTPALRVLLPRLARRLATEGREARADLWPAYVLARGLVEVALALSTPAFVPSADLRDHVNAEAARVVAHAGIAPSAVLGIPVDYAAMAPRGPADEGDLGSLRAFAWLAHATLVLEGSGEEGLTSQVDVAQARTDARAALLLARALDPAVDADAAHAYDRIERVSQFLGGAPEDVTPRDLAKAARDAGLDVRSSGWIANVARVDALRHLVARSRAWTGYGGAGGVAVSASGGGPDAGLDLMRASAGASLCGMRAAVDSHALQMLVAPEVALRRMPSALDVMTWMGSSDARAALHEQRWDEFEGFDPALERAYALRPPEGGPDRHASLYASMLDAVATYLAPSGADRAEPSTSRAIWRRHKLEVALGAWTALRGVMRSFAHPALRAGTASVAATEAQPMGFVEPHPESIAKLVAVVRQAARGMSELGLLPPDSPARTFLSDADALLSGALAVAVHEANDEAISSEEASMMVTRLGTLESRLGADLGAPAVDDVHLDVGSARLLEEGTGEVRDLYIAIAEPRTRKLVLGVGAAVPHYEFTQPAAQPLTVATWRVRLQSEPPPADAFAADYAVDASADAGVPDASR